MNVELGYESWPIILRWNKVKVISLPNGGRKLANGSEWESWRKNKAEK